MLISVEHTRVLCNATIENGVPGWLRNSGRGWVTAEYAMLPRSTVTRTARESERGKIGGRTHEIQRLIGRSLRSVVDMQVLGERTVILDCDVIRRMAARERRRLQARASPWLWRWRRW